MKSSVYRFNSRENPQIKPNFLARTPHLLETTLAKDHPGIAAEKIVEMIPVFGEFASLICQFIFPVTGDNRATLTDFNARRPNQAAGDTAE